MEDSFKVRVERLFGSRLFESVPGSSFPDTSWSVTDGEVERKEWNREDPGREEMPCSSAYDEGFPKNTGRSRVSKKQRWKDDLGDGEEEEREEEEVGDEEGNDVEREEREIRSSIGLDATLDYEEEEDEYDRAAVGREDANDRVYMRDVKDHGPYVNYHTIIEDTSEEVHFDRDPRADHLAATARLKEDKESSGSFRLDSSPDDVASKIKITKGDANLKPILKRKGDQIDSRPKKQVRFDPGFKDSRDEQLNDFQELSTVPQLTERTGAAEPEDSPNVPDYLLNPSKYVHYTFDSVIDVGDESNRRAFDDFWKMVRASKSEPVQSDDTTEPPKSVLFMPRKQAPKATLADCSVQDNHEGICKESLNEPVRVTVRSVRIAATEAQEDEACTMEEDHMDTPVEKSVGSQKSSRQYRSRTHSDDSA